MNTGNKYNDVPRGKNAYLKNNVGFLHLILWYFRDCLDSAGGLEIHMDPGQPVRVLFISSVIFGVTLK